MPEGGASAGRICMVTGCTSGIGKTTAVGLAELGYRVAMVCRDEARGRAALDEVKRKGRNSNARLLLSDLSSQRSVRMLAEEFDRGFDEFHVFVNRAGVFRMSYSVTPEASRQHTPSSTCGSVPPHQPTLGETQEERAIQDG
jgi:NAD(P)-dependent dehydrogenase (short-subunit alcohol dehydrogenase family)